LTLKAVRKLIGIEDSRMNVEDSSIIKPRALELGKHRIALYLNVCFDARDELPMLQAKSTLPRLDQTVEPLLGHDFFFVLFFLAPLDLPLNGVAFLPLKLLSLPFAIDFLSHAEGADIFAGVSALAF
jgi:hypothetical protein